MIETLTAVRFLRFMTSGRTSPALLACEDAAEVYRGEYVVKLRGPVHENGLMLELLATKLAAHFDISSPRPVLVLLDRELADLIASTEVSKADLVRGSIGTNFGTEALVGFATWVVDRRAPEAVFDRAVEVFAFDALIQNPDRRFSNPNLLAKGDELMIIDHEVAFSFLYDIFPTRTPWDLASQAYLADHVFYRQLKSQALDLGRFNTKLQTLTADVIDEALNEIPAEWKNENAVRIRQHLLAVHDHSEEFVENVRRFLA